MKVQILGLMTATALISGCANMEFKTNLDADNFKEYYKASEVEIYESEADAPEQHLNMGLVEGSSCQETQDAPPPNEAEARTQARREAADLGANGVIFQQCIKETSNICVAEYICYGQAIYSEFNEQ
ncbi:Rcs stress response system protein RcsF [Paraferrimonas sedimenticola]|uniref:Exopolysaccharide biosynthesis protein n=1 Tax=Paraferrimonas sedimenticola TaxID=375674 RepID=A0AA37RWV5_9GAMM|nr:Rcs stress response system protein RcsF [Paraferrimonas sedimenticola]GLP96690.1 exopolysaccharide biosynthesis protein [Paraferrimonas sedimenticola]